MIDLKITQLNDLGMVDEVGYCYFTIIKETYAPGIWAGVRSITVEIGNNLVEITYVDLEKKRIYHKADENGPHLKTGDVIKAYVIDLVGAKNVGQERKETE
jgi:hypothetical protein